MKKALAIFLTLCLLLVAIVACAQEEAPAAQGTDSGPDRSDQLYIQVSALSALAYFYDHMMGMRMVGEELGVQTDYVGPADLDLTAMIAAFDQAIARNPQGIVVVGFDDSLNPSIRRAMDEGIPVITVDADLPDSGRLAFVGTGNVNAGRVGGEALIDIIGTSGQVAIMTMPGQSNLEERVQGYMEVFDRYPGIEVVQIVDTRSEPIVAAQAATTLMQQFPDLTAIVAVDSAGGSGAATAVREAGRAGDVVIFAMDRDAEVIQAIEEGVITASLAQQTALMPYYAVQILYNLYNSNVQITTNNAAAGVLGIPAMVDTGVVVITASNARYFMRD